ncbi:MAG: cyclase family protein [Firmicutes bacterium]|nr:cyclase family protein [Bacillota bacterium]
MARLVDLSHPMVDGMPVYPGDDPTRLVQTSSAAEDGYASFRLETGMHAGTHIDAPLHFIPGGAPVSAFPVEAFAGKGCLLDVRGQSVIEYKPEYEAVVTAGDIVLLRTDHSLNYGTAAYYQDHPIVGETLAEFLIAAGIKMLGMDLPSPDLPPFAIHKLLLGANVLLLENLTNLSALTGCIRFEVIAFPIRIAAEGCPVRVVARI